MSFILDALRKSENERRRDAAPGISRAPMAVPRERLPRWALGVMTVLAIGVLGLGAAWWLTQRPGDVPDAAAPAAAATPPPAAVDAPVAVPASTVTGPGGSSVAVTATSIEAPEAGLATASTPRQAATGVEPARSLGELAAPAQNVALSIQEARPEGPLPSLGEIRAQGIAVPALELQLYSYATAAGARFVFINGARYMEGDEIEDDLRVVAIRRDGAVLSRRGRAFLLVPE